MVKKPKRRKLRQPGRCIFCGGGGTRGNPLSDEHVWPSWMHQHLPKCGDAKYWSSYSSGTNVGVTTDRKKPQTGHVYTLKFKIVCKSCNETWMSDIEETAKPILTPIIQGYRPSLEYEHKVKLATWIALKTLVIENDKRATPVLPAEDLAAFRESRKIPPRMKIWVGTHSAFEWSTGIWVRSLTMSFSPQPPMGGLRKNVQTTAFGAGHLFSLAYVSTLAGIDLEIDNPLVCGLWPITDDEWPTEVAPHNAVNRLSNVLDDLESAPNTEWRTIPRS